MAEAQAEALILILMVSVLVSLSKMILQSNLSEKLTMSTLL
jgi:hypothetical protein